MTRGHRHRARTGSVNAFMTAVRVLVLACACALCAPVLGQAFKWRDERGGVHYGETPPAGVRASPVDTRPFGVESDEPRPCHSAACQAERMQVERRREQQADAEQARRESARVAQPAPRGMDMEVFIRLHNGMSEGELLQRAGPPDFQTIDSLRDAIGKTYYWYPTPANPFTTIITLRGGRIFNMERIRRL